MLAALLNRVACARALYTSSTPTQWAAMNLQIRDSFGEYASRGLSTTLVEMIAPPWGLDPAEFLSASFFNQTSMEKFMQTHAGPCGYSFPLDSQAMRVQLFSPLIAAANNGNADMVAFLTNSNSDDTGNAAADVTSGAAAPIAIALRSRNLQLDLLMSAAFGGCFRCFELALKFIEHVGQRSAELSNSPMLWQSGGELLCSLVLESRQNNFSNLLQRALAGRKPAILAQIVAAYPQIKPVLLDEAPIIPMKLLTTRMFGSADVSETVPPLLDAYYTKTITGAPCNAVSAPCGRNLHRLVLDDSSDEVWIVAGAVEDAIRKMMSGEVVAMSRLYLSGIADLHNKIVLYMNKRSPIRAVNDTKSDVRDCARPVCWLQDAEFMQGLSVYSCVFISDVWARHLEHLVASYPSRLKYGGDSQDNDSRRPGRNLSIQSGLARYHNNIMIDIKSKLSFLLPFSKDTVRSSLISMSRAAQFEGVATLL